MSEDASAGRLYAEVVADTRGFRADLEKKLQSQTKGLRATIQAKVELDRAQVRQEIALKVAQASRDVRARITLEVDDASVRRRIAELRGGKATVTVDADTGKARADVARLRLIASRPVTMPVKISTGQALTALGRLSTAASTIPVVTSGLMLAAGAAVNLAAGLFSVAASASQAVGVLAVLPGLAGAAVQGVGALVAGFSGIGKAVKALGKADVAAASTASTSGAARAAAAERVRASTERVRAATERLRDSQIEGAKRVAEARTNGARRIAGAERQAAQSSAAAEERLASAHQTTERALERLTQARADAVERLKDLRLELAGGALDEEDAQLRIERARQELAKTNTSKTATDLDKREADLTLRQAEQRLAEVQARQAELAQEKSRFDSNGIEANKGVVDATLDVIDARKEEAKAAKDVRDTQVEGARAVREAQLLAAKDVKDAQEAQAKSVRNAQRDLRQAMAAGTTATGTQSAAMRGLGTAMDKLGPAGQKFARFLFDTVLPRFREMRSAVQGALLPPLQKAITKSMPLLDTLQGGLVGTGKVMGRLAVQGATMASSPAFRKDLAGIMQSNNRAIGNFGGGALRLVSALRHVIAVAGPILLEPFAKWTKALGKSADEAARTGRNSGKLAAFLERAKAKAKLLGRILKDTAKGLFNLGKLATPSGDTLLDSLAKSAEKFRKATEDPKNREQIQTFFEQAVPVMQQFGDLLNRLVMLFVRFGEATGGGSLDGLFFVLNLIVTVLEKIAAFPGGGALLTAIFTLSGAGFGLGLVAKALGGVVSNVSKLAKYTGVAKLFGALAGPLTGGLGVKGVAKLTALQAGGAIKRGASAASGAVRTGVSAAGSFLADTVGGAVGSAASKAGGVVKRGASRAGTAVKAGVSRAGGVVRKGASSVVSSVASSAAGQAVAASLGKVAGAARTAGAAVTRYAGQLAKSASQAVLRGIAGAASAIGGVAAAAGRGALALGTLALGYARAGLAAAAAGVKQLAMAAAAGVVRVATFAWTAAQWLLNAALNANPISLIVLAIAALVAGVIWAYNNIGWFRDGVNTVFKFIGGIATWLQKTILEPVFKSIGGVITWLIQKIVLPYFTAWKLLFQNVLGPAVLWLWKNIIQPGIRAIGSIIETVWRNVIKPAFDALGKGIEAVKKGFSIAVDAIKTAWNKIGEIAKIPAKFVIETVLNNGILAAWNKVAGFFGIKPDNLRVPLPKGFASGGIYPGYTPGRDVGMAAVSGGEAIMRPEWTRAVGEDYVHSANRAARVGGVAGVARLLGIAGDPGGPRYMGAFAGGGIIDGIKSFFGKAKDYFVGGIRKAASVVVDPVLTAIEQRMSGSTFTQALAAVPRRMVNGFLGWLDTKDSEIGGPGKKAVELARTQLGVPYLWGGTAWDQGLDCSGLIQQAYLRATGKIMPRTTYTQRPWLTPVAGRPRIGDIGQPNPGHTFMYSGDNRIIEAPYTGAFVREVPERSAWWGRPPASFLADRGGPVNEGLNLIDNRSGRREYVITGDVVDLLGGERAVQALNNSAARLYRGRAAVSSLLPTAGGGSGDRPQVVQHIHPQPRQSEYEIGVIAARKLGAALR